MKILVTGGAGYIGSSLVPALLDFDDFKVTVVDNFMYRQASLNHICGDPDFEVIRGDCRDMRLMAPLLAQADVFLPLAAIVGAPACDADRIAAESTNCYAVINAMNHLSRSQRILIPITNSGYGIGGSGECTESSPLKPVSLYGRTKVDVEKAVMDRGNATSFRLATVFGMSPRMRLDLLVNDFVYRALYDRALVLFEGHFRRNYIHVKDVARVFCYALDMGQPDGVYNVGLPDANLTKRELCERIQLQLPKFTFVEAPIGEDPDKRDYIVSNAKITATGYRPTISLDEGITELIKGLSMLRNGIHTNV